MKMLARYLTFLTIALLIGLAVLGGTKDTAKAATAALTDPIKIDTGYISGTLIGDIGKEVRIYRGIPYAAPPVGDLRWKPPQPAAPWQGIRESTAFGKACSQPATIPGVEPPSEDCLSLNVVTGAKKVSDNLPVMVWLHGGGYTTGAGITPSYSSPALPQHGVVLVTINMRLGPIGLLAHPLLSKESSKGVSGNYMFLDMIAALEWVQRNIAAFGGNPKNVTIFGVSGGGAKVACLIASPLAKGLFHRGIMESGAVGENMFPGTPMKDLESIGEKFFARLGVDKDADPLKSARALPPAKILETEASLAKELKKEYGNLFEEAIDQQFLTDSPENIYRTGKQNPVPVITCAILGELTGPGMVVMPHVVPLYVNHLNGVNKAGQKGYACIFDHVPAKWREEGCVSFHALEVLYVFGQKDAFGSTPEGLLYSVLAKASGAKSAYPGLSTDADRKVSETMMVMWTQFARTGNPNVKGLAVWPAYEPATDQYLYIADPLQVKSGFSKIAQKK
jgi:para-nitrobenzyl esterase